jgi:hypothetical protein
MENNDEQEIDIKDYQDDNGNNGEEGEENLGINYEGEYEGEEQIDQNQEGQEEGMEEGQEEEMGEEEAMYEGEEEAIEGRQEEGMEEAQEEAGEEAYAEQNEDNKKENLEDEKNNIQNKIGEINKNEMDINNIENENNNNNKIQIENNLNSSEKKNNLNMNNQKRIELIKNKLNWAQNVNNNKNENIIDKDVEEEDNNNDKNNNFKTYNTTKKEDILSELLGKIQNLKYRQKNFGMKANSNNLDELDKELAKGLENLNKKNIDLNFNNEEQIMNKVPQKIEGEILRNPKFKEIISLINEKETTRNKNFRRIGKNDFLSLMYSKNKNNNFSNINIYSPKINKFPANTFENKTIGFTHKKLGNDKYYISCIDGKAIVNGIR